MPQSARSPLDTSHARMSAVKHDTRSHSRLSQSMCDPCLRARDQRRPGGRRDGLHDLGRETTPSCGAPANAPGDRHRACVASRRRAREIRTVMPSGRPAQGGPSTPEPRRTGKHASPPEASRAAQRQSGPSHKPPSPSRDRGVTPRSGPWRIGWASLFGRSRRRHRDGLLQPCRRLLRSRPRFQNSPNGKVVNG